MSDDPAAVRKKIRSAVTDTGREVLAAPDKPGVTNLLGILSAVSGESVTAIEERFAGSGYGDFKAAVADAVVDELEPVQQRYTALLAEPDELHRVLSEGALQARHVAGETLARVYDAVGFLPPAGMPQWPTA